MHLFLFQLDDCLKSYNIFETKEEMQKRLEVLRKINALVKNWVRKVSEEKVFCVCIDFFVSFLIFKYICNRKHKKKLRVEE